MSHTIFVVLVLFDARIIERENKEVMPRCCRRPMESRGFAGQAGGSACRWWMRREEEIALFVAAENVYLICQTF